MKRERRPKGGAHINQSATRQFVARRRLESRECDFGDFANRSAILQLDGFFKKTLLLRCDVCDASFTLADARSYACASHINGAACSNTLRVRRVLVGSRALESVKADLRDPGIMSELERRVTRALSAKKPKADNAARGRSATEGSRNLTDAIAGGLLKSSPATARGWRKR